MILMVIRSSLLADCGSGRIYICLLMKGDSTLDPAQLFKWAKMLANPQRYTNVALLQVPLEVAQHRNGYFSDEDTPKGSRLKPRAQSAASPAVAGASPPPSSYADRDTPAPKKGRMQVWSAGASPSPLLPPVAPGDADAGRWITYERKNVVPLSNHTCCTS